MADTRQQRKEQIAKVFGVHPKTVAIWARAGCPHEKGGPKKPYYFDAEKVAAWLEEQGRTGRPGRPATGGATDDLRQAQLRLTIERALLTKQRREVAGGKLHNVGQCRQRRLRKIHAVKSLLCSLARSVSAELVGKTRAQIEAALNARVDGILSAFAGESINDRSG